MIYSVWTFNVARYLQGGKNPKIWRVNKPRKDNVQFMLSRSSSFSGALSSCRAFGAQVLRRIVYGEELLVHYGNNYEFCRSRILL